MRKAPRTTSGAISRAWSLFQGREQPSQLEVLRVVALQQRRVVDLQARCVPPANATRRAAPRDASTPAKRDASCASARYGFAEGITRGVKKSSAADLGARVGAAVDTSRSSVASGLPSTELGDAADVMSAARADRCATDVDFFEVRG